MLRERRQQNGAERDAEQRARELHQPVRVRDPRDASIAERGRKLRVDERRNLRRRHADHGRSHRQQHATHAFVLPVEPRPRQHADRDERPDLQRELRDAADQHAPRERRDRRIAIRREEQRGADDRQVEQHRRERRNREAPVNVEHATGERDERDEQDVREHDPDHLRGQLDLAWRLLESGGQQIDEPRRRENADHGDREQRNREQRADASDERLRLRFAALPAVLGEDRHERLRERALGKQPAQDVGQAERRLERVHLQPGAEGGRLEALADETRDPGQQRHAADRRKRVQELQSAGPDPAETCRAERMRSAAKHGARASVSEHESM